MINFSELFDQLQRDAEHFQVLEKSGKVIEVTGLAIEAQGPDAALGSLCQIHTGHEKRGPIAEVVGFRGNRVLLMPLEPIGNLHPGCSVTLANHLSAVPAGPGLVGRVIDGLGRPIDGKGSIPTKTYLSHTQSMAPSPMMRRKISAPMQTGVRAIDTFIPIGLGQRMGIFAGSGVGKSTLLSMITRGCDSDITIIALVGERGRELREFVENDLGPEGLAKAIVVVSTSDQPAALRLRAAFVATTLAEHFRDCGKNVLFLMDSLTRLAMAQREIGLSVGEPPTSRGYTPSVFSLLPKLLERTGMGETGSITALYTVLVEGDDLSEPVSDAVRGILDGHIVLKRSLAVGNHYPPIDVLESLSRLARSVCTREQLELAGKARDLMALYRKNEDLITVGAYVPKSNPKIDLAIAKQPLLDAFLRQDAHELISKESAWDKLGSCLSS